jgi:hypothetical protein
MRMRDRLSRMKRLVPLLIVLGLSVSSTGCYGSYGAFNALHRWNGHATSSRISNSAIHFLLLLGIYELAIVGDIVIFNNIEFLTGDRVFK